MLFLFFFFNLHFATCLLLPVSLRPSPSTSHIYSSLTTQLSVWSSIHLQTPPEQSISRSPFTQHMPSFFFFFSPPSQTSLFTATSLCHLAIFLPFPHCCCFFFFFYLSSFPLPHHHPPGLSHPESGLSGWSDCSRCSQATNICFPCSRCISTLLIRLTALTPQSLLSLLLP